MAKLANIIKTGALGLGLLALTAMPLDAQRNKYSLLKQPGRQHFIDWEKMKYLIDYPIGDTKSPDTYCLSKAARRYFSNIPKKEKEKNYCLPKQEKRYSKHSNK